jgi:Holliday junction resolvase RusA-like endonuclease
MPPAINAMYKRGKSSFYKSRDAKLAFEACQWETRSQYRGKPLTGPVELFLTFYEGSRRLDVDAREKSTLDLMSGIIYVNDKQVKKLHIEQLVDKAQPRVEVVISEI